MVHFLYNFALTSQPTKKRNPLSRWLHWQLYKYLRKNLVEYYKRISRNCLGIDVNTNIVVSLTSIPSRIETVYLAILSLLNQTKRPKKIVLWLGREYFPNGEIELPNTLLDLKSLGLEIEFCADLKAHTKYHYAFKKYPDQLVVTVDDDIIYPRTLINTLFDNHLKYPNSIVANRVRFVGVENNRFKPYREWKINTVSKDPSLKTFATGVSGVLYQPKLFLNTIFDLDGISKTECIGDDIWLKANQIVSNIPVIFTSVYFKQFMQIPNSQLENLHSKNVFERDNDRQIKEVFEYFGITQKFFS
jgi:hypothetical protein